MAEAQATRDIKMHAFIADTDQDETGRKWQKLKSELTTRFRNTEMDPQNTKTGKMNTETEHTITEIGTIGTETELLITERDYYLPKRSYFICIDKCSKMKIPDDTMNKA